MQRKDLILKVKNRKIALNLTIKQIANLTGLSYQTVVRFLNGKDVKLSTVEKITTLLGLDLAGNEIISIQEILEKRAETKAMYIISLVQDTLSVEEQGLEKKELVKLLEFAKNQFLTINRELLWSN